MATQFRLKGTMRVLACILLLACSGPAFCKAGDPIQFDIASQPLSAALKSFAAQARMQILYRQDTVEGATANAVVGSYDKRSALQQLLKGTGLEVVFSTDNAATIRAKAEGSINMEDGADARSMRLTQADPSGTELKTAGAAENQHTANRTTVSESSAESSEKKEQEIVVTGSHIRNANPTSPVHVVTRKDIEASGYSQIGAVIRSLPENFSGGQNPGVVYGGQNIQNQNSTNSSTVNLRGLGTDATLVLLNGHRLAADAFFQGPDISMVPLSAIERVEIVADGASALYGSDAIAGVVNMILRKDFNGGEASARLGTTTQGGGFERTYSVLGGLSRVDWHALANLEYSKTDAVTAGQRGFSSGAVPTRTLLRPESKKSAFISLGHDIGENMSLYADVNVSARDVHSDEKSTPTGTRAIGDSHSSSRSVAPVLELELGAGWKASVTALYAADSNAIGYDYVTGANITKIKTRFRNELKYGEIATDGKLLDLASGSVKAAFGGGIRSEKYSTSYPGNSGYLNPGRDVKYVFAEFLAPLVSSSASRAGLHDLELSVSGRTEDYSDFGRTKNPRIGVRYVPFDDLTVRGTWGTSFKAPSFTQMYQGYALFLYPANILGSSQAGQALYRSGGNRALGPESSTSWTVGMDYAPEEIRSLTISAVYFNIDYTDRVLQPIASVVTGFSNPVYVPFVDYAPTAAALSSLVSGAESFTNPFGLTYDPASIVGVLNNSYQNATAQLVHGFDLSYRQSFDLQEGTLSIFANGTWTTLEQNTIPNTPAIRLSGTIFNVPDFKARTGMTWQRGGISASGILNHVSSSSDTGLVAKPKIKAWSTVDVNVSYRFSGLAKLTDGLRLAFAASNVFDRDPPFAQSPGLAIPGLTFDSTNSSFLGRTISVSIAKAW